MSDLLKELSENMLANMDANQQDPERFDREQWEREKKCTPSKLISTDEVKEDLEQEEGGDEVEEDFNEEGGGRGEAEQPQVKPIPFGKGGSR